ncbi:Plasmodium vivax Vir protein, putative [Plasmodium vivax]|uniref:Vir protein, putative n=1 Tax=Plasmodium vivax TaxID=5855 RepID=A0A1G4EBV0_PLAVI|nr:Plasmodium vivax Vir protein, putative [Plasmodium vivax]
MSGPNLDNLTSNILYKQWSNEVSGSSYLSFCYDFPPTYNIYKNISNLCRKLLRNLHDMQYRENDECYTCGHCKLLNYWLYDHVKQILGSQYKSKYTEIITELHKVWSNYKIHKLQDLGRLQIVVVDPPCKPETPIPDIQDIEDKKNIHEHCLNYYEISKNSRSNECQEYKDYIQRQSLPYLKFESLFPIYKDNCTTYYKHCKSYDPKNLGTDSNCPQKIEIAEPFEELAGPLGQTSLEEGGEREIRKEEKQVSEDKEREAGVRVDDRGRVIGGEETVEAMRTIQFDLDPGKAIRSGPAHVDGQGDVVLTDSEPSASNSFVMPVGLSLFGIASFSSILYKFTPLRSVFNKLIHKNRSPISNLHEVPEDLLEYMIKSGGKHRDNGPNYIAYQPT